MSKNKLAVSIQTSAAVILVALCFIIADSLRERIVAAGDRAPEFEVITDSGRRVSASDFGGRILVLNFWATWCPPCVDEMPSLKAMSAQLGAKGVVVLGVSVDQNEGAYQRFLRDAKVTFPTARDPEARISSSYGTFKYPETYVIDVNGRVRQKHIGPRNWLDPELVQSIEALL